MIQRKIRQVHQHIPFEHLFILPEANGSFPAVLLIHEYTGLTESTLVHAKRLAKLGYAVLAADFYGVDNRPSNIEEARAVHRIYRNNRSLMRGRAKMCLDVLTDQTEINANQVFALGFSFGGGAVLELARSGAKLCAVASVYGYLDTTHPIKTGDVSCPLLAIKVENDPVVPQEHVVLFEREMAESETDYEIVEFRKVQHGFANSLDTAFDNEQTERMWKLVLEFYSAQD